MSKKSEQINQIKPCPFCGGVDVYLWVPLGATNHYSMACVCGAKSPIIEEWGAKSKAYAAALQQWNKRAPKIEN